jgi:hypothetical protein
MTNLKEDICAISLKINDYGLPPRGGTQGKDEKDRLTGRMELRREVAEYTVQRSASWTGCCAPDRRTVPGGGLNSEWPRVVVAASRAGRERHGQPCGDGPREIGPVVPRSCETAGAGPASGAPSIQCAPSCADAALAAYCGAERSGCEDVPGSAAEANESPARSPGPAAAQPEEGCYGEPSTLPDAPDSASVHQARNAILHPDVRQSPRPCEQNRAEPQAPMPLSKGATQQGLVGNRAGIELRIAWCSG